MSLTICEHLKPGGVRCGSPALAEQKYCHYHAGVHRVVPHTNLFVMAWNPTRESEPYNPCELPFLEDAAAIQIGFMQLINGVAQQRIDIRRAKLILSALHGAAANLRQMDAALAKCEAAKQPSANERENPQTSKSGVDEAPVTAPSSAEESDKDEAPAAAACPSQETATTGQPAHDNVAPANEAPAAKKQPASVGVRVEARKRLGEGAGRNSRSLRSG
jgi:hypothetical protein